MRIPLLTHTVYQNQNAPKVSYIPDESRIESRSSIVTISFPLLQVRSIDRTSDFVCDDDGKGDSARHLHGPQWKPQNRHFQRFIANRTDRYQERKASLSINNQEKNPISN